MGKSRQVLVISGVGDTVDIRECSNGRFVIEESDVLRRPARRPLPQSFVQHAQRSAKVYRSQCPNHMEWNENSQRGIETKDANYLSQMRKRDWRKRKGKRGTSRIRSQGQ